MITTNLLPGVFTAVSSNTASPAVSSRYAHVRTLDVLQPLLDEGWTVRRQIVAQSHVILPEHRAHEIRLAAAGQRQVGDSIPEIIIRNGADGATALSVSAGLFRLICANGLSVGAASFEVRVRHVGVDLQQRVITAARQIAAKTEELPEIVSKWSERALSWHERTEFNRRAAALRWSEANLTVDMTSFGMPLRYEDSGADLWRTFNRAQESVIRGGIKVSRHLPQIGTEIVTRRARAVSSIDTAARLNADLWLLAEEFAN
jgi:hypothetical protein